MSKAHQEDITGHAELEGAGRNNGLYTAKYGLVMGSGKKIYL